MEANKEMRNTLDYKRAIILFVDDEEKTLKYFSRIFSNDFRILTSTSVEEATQVIEQKANEIAILITDQRMPKRKGVDLLKFTRENHPHIVRLLTTAYTDLDSAIEAVNSGEIFRYITKPWNIDKLNDHLTDAMNLYLAREQERNLLAGKRQAMYQLAGNIAHELRTPLLSILAAAKGTGNYMPILVDAYRTAKKSEHGLQPIRDHHLSTLTNTLTDIITEASHSLTIIDMLLMNIRGMEIGAEAFSILSMRECISESLDRFPFRDKQKDLIEVTGTEDFQFRGVKLLIIHVYYNLIKNALYAIACSGGTGSITISIRNGKYQNHVYFKDTGHGIDPAVMPYIFDNFYSTRTSHNEGNIGIGLSFCKNVLMHFNANIECISEEGLYTEFILGFPVLPGN